MLTNSAGSGVGAYLEGGLNGNGLTVTHGGGSAHAIEATGLATSTSVIKAIGVGATPTIHATALAGYAMVAESDTTSPTRAALRLVPQDTPPSTALMGDIFCDTTGILWIYTTSWTKVGTQS